MSRSVDQFYASPQLSNVQEPLTGSEPTGVRYRIVALTIAMAIILYLDRWALNPITATVVKDLQTNKENFGWSNTAFFWAYAICQVPAGWLADRFGARRMLAVYVVAWSLATIALGFVPGLFALIALRGVLGAAQAGAYPAAGSYLKSWTNLTSRARANSLVAAGGRVGALLAFLITAWLGLQLQRYLGLPQGWRGSLVIFGCLGLVWTALFFWYFRDRPGEHRGCNAAELAIIGSDPPGSKVVPLPILKLLLSLNVWILSLSGFLVNVGWIFLTAWQTTYILDTFSDQLRSWVPADANEAEIAKVQEVFASWMTALPLCFAILGGVVGGIAADFFLRRFGPIWGRRVPGLLAGGISGAAYVVCHFVDNVWIFLGLMLFISFAIDFGLGALWATYQDFGGRHVGSVLGFANMWGNLGAGLCGWYYGRLARLDQWPLVFTISAVALFLMSASWLLVDPTRMLDKEEASPQTS
jgi:MFS family permease